MSIIVNKPVNVINQDEFMKIDYEVMRQVFDIHNKYGAFCDEKIYSNELAYRCQDAGLTASREIQITLTHKSFRRTYYIDLLINDSAVYELKAHRHLSNENVQQLLNYLLLTNAKHGKLISFGSASIKHKFVSTTLDLSTRYDMTVVTKSWDPRSEKGEKLPQALSSILEDWGGFLSVSLYKEALSAILSDGVGLEGLIQFSTGKRKIGTQKELFLAPDVIFRVSGYSKEMVSNTRKQLNRLLYNSSAKVIQWVNFDHHRVTIESLTE